MISHPHMRRFSHEAMTTTFDVIIIHEDPDYARTAAGVVFTEIDRLERLLSRHDPGSDLAQANRLQPGEYLVVNMDVVECLEIASKAYLETGGTFDVAYRSTQNGTRPSAMEALLLSRPDAIEPEAPSEFLVGVDPALGTPWTARMGSPGVADRDALSVGGRAGMSSGAPDNEESSGGLDIDLGGIGKGYALDKAQLIFDDWAIDNALISSGTSTVIARGPGPEGRGWPVGVSGDYADLTGVSIAHLLDCALSGSGTAVKGQHIRVPASGKAAPAVAAWAKSRSAAWTDAISTALMILPEDAAHDLAVNDLGLAAIVIYPGTTCPTCRNFGDW